MNPLLYARIKRIQPVKHIQSYQKLKHQLSKLWPMYFEMDMEFYSMTTLRKAKPLIVGYLID